MKNGACCWESVGVDTGATMLRKHLLQTSWITCLHWRLREGTPIDQRC